MEIRIKKNKPELFHAEETAPGDVCIFRSESRCGGFDGQLAIRICGRSKPTFLMLEDYEVYVMDDADMEKYMFEIVEAQLIVNQ